MKKIINYIRQITIVSVVLVIPFFYVLFFLKAFWDPYTNMKNVPVAVVNLDSGEIGKKIVDKIELSNLMKVELLDSDKMAENGVKERKYYSSITIPENFTNDIENMKKVEIVYRSNKKFNFIASQIYERVAIEVQHSIKENVAFEIIKKLKSGIEESYGKMGKLNDGLGQLKDGTDKLLGGIKTLDGKYIEFNSGIASLNDGIKQIDTGLNTYVSSINKSVDGLDLMSDGVITLGDKISILKISSKFNKLYDGAKTVKNENVKKRVNDGGEQLILGIKKVNGGSDKLKNASILVKDAISQIENGTAQLSSGLNIAKTAVNNSVIETSKKIVALENLEDFMGGIVSLKEIDIDNVDNYGTVFAAYFMSISLWVGSLVIMVVMYYDVKKRFGIFDRENNNTKKQYIFYLALILLQSIILPFLIKFSFDFNKLNFFIFIISTIVVDLAFFSMVYFFIILFNDVGKFISVMLLIIQISSSAGTFPIETSPKIFFDIYPFIPMKYSVNIFKEAFGGYEYSFFIQNFKFLIFVFILFSILSMLCVEIKNRLKNKNL